MNDSALAAIATVATIATVGNSVNNDSSAMTMPLNPTNATSVGNTLAGTDVGIGAGHGMSKGSLEEAAQATRVLLLFLMLEFAVLWLLCVALVAHVRYYRAAAFRGDETAARKILLPAFEPLLIVLAVFNAVFTVLMTVALATEYYGSYVPPVVLETLYSGHQFGFTLILVFMLQKSVSLPALRRAVIVATLLSGYTIPYIWYVTSYGNPAKQATYVDWLHVLRAVVLLLSVYVFVRPPSRASVRTLRELAVYNVMRYALTTVHMVLLMNPSTREDAKYALYATLIWIAFNPLVIWRVLKADTDYWRGMGQRAVALQSLFKEKSHMHEGVSSQGLHVLIELHRKYVLDFALLELRQQIGVGATSTVFRGTFRSKHRVAVKVYQPHSFSEDVIAGFSHEAALCGLLHHPNVVKFYGMCVAPPTICLVFELCQGSLDDVLRMHTLRVYPPARQQLLINVGYMLDAARAVAYIHSFSPPFIHRDVKPSNFLVDADCNVKLSDFGESRALAKIEEAQTREQRTTSRGSVGSRESGKSKGSARGSRWTASTKDSKMHSPITATTDEALESPLATVHWTVKGTADYMAPEVISGKGGVACYDEAADIYSLAITMWDILHPGAEKFASKSHLYVFDRVLNGARPPLDPSLLPSLRDLIQCAWQAEPRQRPSALTIVAVLQEIQESLSAGVVVDVLDELQQLATNQHEASSSTPVMGGKFSGAAATDVLLEHSYVSSLAEATRMGNAWMDAGLLHHARHAQAFESSSAALFYFAVDSNAKLRQAISAASRLSTPSSSSTGIPILTAVPLSCGRESSRHSRRRASWSSNFGGPGLHAGVCACPQLAQRHTDTRGVRDKLRHKTLARRPMPDDLVLTTALLTDDRDGSCDEHFDAFVSRGGSVTSSRDGR